MRELTPQEIVEKLDENIVGQADAKRAVAIALRNRWRWKQLDEDVRKEITPKNIIMIGPTGVGKTEITRRLAAFTRAPFIKVEATKYTEVGYYGRDVESMIRDLVESAANIIRNEKRGEVEKEVENRVEERLLDMLLPPMEGWVAGEDSEEEKERKAKHDRNREKFRKMLKDGKLEESEVELTIEQRSNPMQMFSNMGIEQMDMDMQNMFEKLIPKQNSDRKLKVEDARKILFEQELENAMDKDAVYEEAIALAEDNGILFIDELDKICSSSEGGRSADVSRQGVQRDLLPIVEGTTVQTKHGSIRTDNILFIAAGAFHSVRPADLMPELQGRFPIRVELKDLTRDDFYRILTEPSCSLPMQYQALIGTEGIKLKFTDDALNSLADIAFELNQTTQNIGARRLHTILEKLLEEISFDATIMKEKTFTIDADYVKQGLGSLIESEDLSKFIL